MRDNNCLNNFKNLVEVYFFTSCGLNHKNVTMEIEK